MLYDAPVEYKKLFLRREREHMMGHMHPWIFSQALKSAPSGEVKNGDIIDIYSADGKRFYARGYYNGNSQIAVRILTRRQDEAIDVNFFERKFRELFAMRKRFIDEKKTNAFRVVFGESDGMPGLIIDKYDRTFVVQIHTLGMEMRRTEITAALKKVFDFETIFERSDVGVRRQEGLENLPVGVIAGDEPAVEIEIMENSVRFLVNIKDGQKTGFFLDQRENRLALQKYVNNARVLNCFCYTAGFSVYAALAGAREVVSVDIAKPALETAKRNFELNGIDAGKHQFIAEDVFETLNRFEQKKETFDVIILDPPAFVKNKKSLEKGLSGYLFINEKALRILPPGGILVSSSCSAHVTDEMFQRMLSMAAAKAGCGLRTIEIKHQPIDHPFNPHFPEGKYLKFYIMLKV